MAMKRKIAKNAKARSWNFSIKGFFKAFGLKF